MDDESIPMVLALANAALRNRPVEHKSPLYDQFLPTEDHLTEVADTIGLECISGLSDVLQSSTVPDIDYFRSLPSEYVKDWGVYVLILEMEGHTPALYVGSASRDGGGFEARMKDYDNRRVLPRLVSKCLENGYEITHKGLLVSAKEPTAAHGPMGRLLIRALEGLFEHTFLARSTNAGHFQRNLVPFAADWESGVPGLVHWDLNAAWDGLCTHSPLNEAVTSDFFSSAEQLEQYAKERHTSDLLRRAVRAKKRRANLKAQDPQAYRALRLKGYAKESREAQRASAKRYRDKRNAEDPIEFPAYMRASRKRRRANAADEKRHYCAPCDKSYQTGDGLKYHLNTAKHRGRASATKRQTTLTWTTSNAEDGSI